MGAKERDPADERGRQPYQIPELENRNDGEDSDGSDENDDDEPVVIPVDDAEAEQEHQAWMAALRAENEE
jgi:hypothetical protein